MGMMNNFRRAFSVEDSDQQLTGDQDDYGVIGEDVAGDARWLDRGGRRISTIDLSIGDRFCLLAGADGAASATALAAVAA